MNSNNLHTRSIGQKHIQFGILEWQRQDGSRSVFCSDK